MFTTWRRHVIPRATTSTRDGWRPIHCKLYVTREVSRGCYSISCYTDWPTTRCNDTRARYCNNILTRVNKIRSQMKVVDLTKLFYAVIQTGWRIFYKPSSVQQTFRTNKQLKVVNSYYLLQRPKNTREVKEKA